MAIQSLCLLSEAEQVLNYHETVRVQERWRYEQPQVHDYQSSLDLDHDHDHDHAIYLFLFLGYLH